MVLLFVRLAKICRAGSATVRICLAETFLSCCTIPEGHLISSNSIVEALPSPKCASRLPPLTLSPFEISRDCQRLTPPIVARRLTSAPIAERFEIVPLQRSTTHEFVFPLL